MVRKDYVSTPDGKAFLGNPENPQANVFYPTAEGGNRIIYEPAQMHAWNHFSALTTGYQIQFYATAFGKHAPPTALASTNQIWYFKEAAEFVGLIGFFMLFIALVQLLVKRPWFTDVKTDVLEFDGPATAPKKALFWVIVAVSAAFPAVYYATLMGKLPAGLAQLKYLSLIVTAIAGIAAIVALARQKSDKIFGLLVIASASFVTFGLTAGAGSLFNLSPVFNEPQTNALIYWVRLRRWLENGTEVLRDSGHHCRIWLYYPFHRRCVVPDRFQDLAVRGAGFQYTPCADGLGIYALLLPLFLHQRHCASDKYQQQIPNGREGIFSCFLDELRRLARMASDPVWQVVYHGRRGMANGKPEQHNALRHAGNPVHLDVAYQEIPGEDKQCVYRSLPQHDRRYNDRDFDYDDVYSPSIVV